MTKSLGELLICAIPVLMVGCGSKPLEADPRAQSPANTQPSMNKRALSANDRSPQAPDVDIFTASGEGNLQAIKQHIAAGTDLDVKEPAGGGTPLIVTTVTGQTEAAKLLIKSGASLSATNNDGATALHTAAFFGQPEMVKLLLQSGAEVNAKNERGETPLDTVDDEWTDEVHGLYRMIAAMFQLELDLERIKSARPLIAKILREHTGKRKDGT